MPARTISAIAASVSKRLLPQLASERRKLRVRPAEPPCRWRSRPSSCGQRCRNSSWPPPDDPSPIGCPRRRRSTSPRSLSVSSHSTSAPPGTRPSACSANAAGTGCRCHRAHRFEELSRWAPSIPPPPRVAQRLSATALARAAAASVQRNDPILQIVELEAERIPTERIGQHQIRTGVDVAPMNCAHSLGVGQVPHFGRVARFEPEREQAGSHRTVGEKSHRSDGRPIDERTWSLLGHDDVSRLRRWNDRRSSGVAPPKDRAPLDPPVSKYRETPLGRDTAGAVTGEDRWQRTRQANPAPVS